MNKVALIGRLTRDPNIHYTQGQEPTCIARYTLAVDRRYKREGEQNADFISCIAFGKSGEFAEKYLRQGVKIAVAGRIQTGSYTNRDGAKVYTTDVVAEQQEFVESKAANDGHRASEAPQARGAQTTTRPLPPPPSRQPTDADGFMVIPDGIEDEMPFI